MKAHELLEAVGEIDGKYIVQAGKTDARRKKRAYLKWIAAAAFFCMVIALAVTVPHITNKKGSVDGDIPQGEKMGNAEMEKQKNGSEEVSISEGIGDYPPMIMVDGVVYTDAYEEYKGKTEGRQIGKAGAYAETGIPSKDGEQNFDRTSGVEYFRVDQDTLAVCVDGTWRAFRASKDSTSEIPKEQIPKEHLDPAYGAETQDAPVDESTYSEAKTYSKEILDLQNRISSAMGPENELSFVTSSMVLEDPDRIRVIVNTKDEEQIALLKSYNTEGVRMEIEYSAGTGTEE